MRQTFVRRGHDAKSIEVAKSRDSGAVDGCEKAFAARQTGSIQSSAALVEPGVSQQAFKHATGIRVAGVMAARVTPISKIPIDGTGFGD